MNLIAICPLGATELTVNGLHQWDYGRKLEIHSNDLPAIVEVHFACPGMDEAVVRVSSAINGVATVTIPDRCLEQSSPITAWVYEVGETYGQTIKTLTLNIMARKRPQTMESIDPENSDKYTEAVAAMDEIAKALEKTLEGGVVKAESAIYADFAKQHYENNIEEQDLNDKKESGWYHGRSAFITNSPVSGGYYLIIEIVRYTASWLIQRVTAIKSSGETEIWVRSFYGGNTWSAWTSVITGYNIGTQKVKSAESATTATSAKVAENASEAQIAKSSETRSITQLSQLRSLARNQEYTSYAVVIDADIVVSDSTIPKGSSGYFIVGTTTTSDGLATLNLVDPTGNHISWTYTSQGDTWSSVRQSGLNFSDEWQGGNPTLTNVILPSTGFYAFDITIPLNRDTFHTTLCTYVDKFRTEFFVGYYSQTMTTTGYDPDTGESGDTFSEKFGFFIDVDSYGRIRLLVNDSTLGPINMDLDYVNRMEETNLLGIYTGINADLVTIKYKKLWG